MTSCQKLSPCESYDLRLPLPGFRSKEVILVTTLLDPKLYPAQELEKLYFRRWNVELHFRQIKTMLAWMSCAASPPRWFSKSWRCIGSLTISFAP
jgi:hypothetical protein